MSELGLDTFWQGVTGGLEEGENLLQAAMRELAEETGFISSELKQIDFSYSFPMREEWRKLYGSDSTEVVEHVFVALINGQQEPTLSWEHDNWKWCNMQQAVKLLKYPGNIEALKQCDEYLKLRYSQ